MTHDQITLIIILGFIVLLCLVGAIEDWNKDKK